MKKNGRRKVEEKKWRKRGTRRRTRRGTTTITRKECVYEENQIKWRDRMKCLKNRKKVHWIKWTTNGRRTNERKKPEEINMKGKDKGRKQKINYKEWERDWKTEWTKNKKLNKKTRAKNKLQNLIG